MIERHSRVWLSAQGWQHAMRGLPVAPGADAQAWQQAGLPLTGRRADADAGPDEVCLGLSMPPKACGSKPRLALRVERAGVERVLPPLELDAVAAAVPAAWQPAYRALVKNAASAALPLRVFGSLALQAMTGKAYLTASSDIDLLFYPETASRLTLAIALLDRHAASLPLDGEIVFPHGEAVSWKEWRAVHGACPDARVLVKGRHAVRLASCASLLSTLEPA